jgi:hypothetical protein
MHHHVSYSIGPCLLAKVNSKAATYPVAPDPASLTRRAPAPPHVTWQRTHWEGFGAPRVQRLWIAPP